MKGKIFDLLKRPTIWMLVILIFFSLGLSFTHFKYDVSYDAIVQTYGTLFGALIGSFLAGSITLSSTKRQINHLKDSEDAKKVDEEKKAILVLKNKLSDTDLLTLLVIDENKYVFGHEEMFLINKASDSLTDTKTFVDANSFRFSVNVLEKVYKIIRNLDVIISTVFRCSTTSNMNDIDALKNNKIYERSLESYKDLYEELFGISK